MFTLHNIIIKVKEILLEVLFPMFIRMFMFTLGTSLLACSQFVTKLKPISILFWCQPQARQICVNCKLKPGNAVTKKTSGHLCKLEKGP